MSKLEISEVVYQQHCFFGTGKTKNVAFRIEQLKILKQAIDEHKKAIVEALKAKKFLWQ